jgi:small-conductance mechanosensitive channel
MNWDVDLTNVVIPLIYIVGSLGAGLLIKKIILLRLRKASNKTKWKGDDIIINSFRGIIIFLTLMVSIYFCVHHLPFRDSFVNAADKIIFSLIVLSISMLIGRILVGFIKTKTASSTGIFASSSIISNVTRVIVFLVAALVILQTFGISVTPVLTALGVGGLAVALALQDTLSNLFSGIQLIASQQIRTGDYIKLDTGEDGYIFDITRRNTTILRGQEFVSQYLIKHEFIKALHMQFKKNSIEIPFPTRTVLLKKHLLT